MSTFLDIFQLESNYPVFIGICQNLGIGEIVALTRTCRELAGLYQSLLPIQWNVDRALRRFVSDPKTFRSQMGKCNALVSGSVPVQFFERVVWPESDLDVFIEDCEDADSFAAYLSKAEGYKLVDTVGGNEYIQPDVSNVQSFVRQTSSMAKAKLQIVRTTGIPVQAILRNFHTTVVVNFFSWNKAYSIYPMSTFVSYDGYMMRYMDDFVSPFIKKYESRGWNFQPKSWPDMEDRTSKHGIQPSRRVGDRFTWSIPFDTSGVTKPPVPDLVIEHANFTVRSIEFHPEENMSCYRIGASTFAACTLKYRYTWGSNAWKGFVGRIMDYLALEELHKLDPEARPEDFGQLVLDPDGLSGYLDIEKPETWTYHDEKIPDLYQQWMQSYAVQ